MKVICFLLLIAISALVTGRVCAAQGDAKPLDSHGNVRQSEEKNSPRVHAPASKPARAGRGPEGLRKPMPANPANVASTARTQSGAVAVRGSTQNEAIYRALPVRPGGTLRPAASGAAPSRHRDPNAAMIGGAANSNGRGTASLDGAQTNLRSSRN